MERLVSTLNKLSEKSKEQYHRPYDRFEWPETISEGSYWFSPELMSTYSAECSRSISQDQAIELSKWERARTAACAASPAFRGGCVFRAAFSGKTRVVGDDRLELPTPSV